MTRQSIAGLLIMPLALALGGCELDQRWVERHDARVRDVAEASWCDTGQRPRTGLTVIAASRTEACKNTADRHHYTAREPAQRRRPEIAAVAVPIAPAPPVRNRRSIPSVSVDRITPAASRTTIPIEGEHSVSTQCLAACPVQSDPDASNKLGGYRNAVCHDTCMVKNLPAASPNRDLYEREAERDLDAIRRIHNDERAD